MNDILKKVGEDLATQVVQQELPTTELNVLVPKVNHKWLLEILLAWLYRQMNSILLVSEDTDYLDKYLNSLALLIEQPRKLEKVILSFEFNLDQNSKGRAKKIFQQLAHKRLYSFDMNKFLSLVEDSADTEKWDSIFAQLINETRSNNYFLVVKDFHKPFARQNIQRFQYVARSFFYAVRPSNCLTILAPLSWQNYVHDIEYGIMGTLIRHCQPFLFTPRPNEIPLSPIENLAPDRAFDFNYLE